MHLLGRRPEFAALDEAAADAAPERGGPVVVLHGPAGVGKSALAVSWLRERTDRFPDGLLYADLRGHAPGGPADPAEALGGFLRALGRRTVPADLAEVSALWRSTAAPLRLAVLLDGAASAAQVRPLLAGAAHTVTVVTSRTRLTGLALDGARLHGVGLLDADHATAVLAQRVGAERMAAEPRAAAAVVEHCAGLPLALCVAGARIAARPRHPLSATAEALRREADRLAALRLDGDAATAVEAALDASYAVLAPDAARLYRLLGLLPVAEFSSAVAGAAAELPLPEADRLLDALAAEHLLEELDGERHRFHDLIRLHAGELGRTGESAADGRAAVRRVGEHHLAAATAAEAAIHPGHRTLARDYRQPPWHVTEFADSAAAVDWLDRHRAQLTAVLRAAARDQQDGLVWQLTDAMWPLFNRLRLHRLQVEAHALGLQAARRAGDREAEKRMLTSGGYGLRSAGRPAEAADWYRQALELALADGDSRTEAQARSGIGKAHRLAGELDAARAQFEQVLGLRAAIGYRRGVGLAHVALGEVAVDARDLAEAVRQFTDAVTALAQTPDLHELARARAMLGRAHTATGHHRRAERELTTALAEFSAAGSTHWAARTVEWLGELALAEVDFDLARERFAESLARYRELGAPDTARLADRLEHVAAGERTQARRASDRATDGRPEGWADLRPPSTG
ncbi:ATP-binding protein [Kitasatospora sp. NPDC002522]